MIRAIKLLLLGMFLLVACGNAGYAQDFQKGAEAYKKGDYATALRELKPLAEQGNAWAQRDLGVMYAEGQGVTQDYKEAAQWFRAAAEQGDAKAQFNLGLMYANGQGVTQDYKEAMKWYRKSAEKGHANAQNNLGNLCKRSLTDSICERIG